MSKKRILFAESGPQLPRGTQESQDYLKKLDVLRFNHTGNQRTSFIRTRNEIEHILGLRYNTIDHIYEDSLKEVEGLEVIFKRPEMKDDGNEDGDGKVAYAIYPILIPYIPDTEPLVDSDLPNRFVIPKSIIEPYLVHTDPNEHLNNNQQRAFALEFYLGQDSKGEYYIIMQHVDINLRTFICGETHNPVTIPTP